MDILFHIIGFLGMLCVVAAFFAIERSYLTNNDIRYYLINLSGAILLIVSLLYHFNLGSFVIEVFWIIISVLGILRCRKKSSKCHPK